MNKSFKIAAVVAVIAAASLISPSVTNASNEELDQFEGARVFLGYGILFNILILVFGKWSKHDQSALFKNLIRISLVVTFAGFLVCLVGAMIELVAIFQ